MLYLVANIYVYEVFYKMINVLKIHKKNEATGIFDCSFRKSCS